MFLRRSLTRAPSSPTTSTHSSTPSTMATKVRQTFLAFSTYWTPTVPTTTRSRISIADISAPKPKADYIKLDIYGNPVSVSLPVKADRPLSSHASSETVASDGAASASTVELAGEGDVLERFLEELGVAEGQEREAFVKRNAAHLNPLTPASRVIIVEAEMARVIENERVALVAADPTLGLSPPTTPVIKTTSVWQHDPSHPRKMARMSVRERETMKAREKVFRALLLREE